MLGAKLIPAVVEYDQRGGAATQRNEEFAIHGDGLFF